MSKVSTGIFRKILLTLLSAIPFSLIFSSIIGVIVVPLPAEWPLLATIAFVVAGIVLALICARKIRQMSAIGDSEEARRFAKKTNRYFAFVTVFIWIIGLVVTYFIPAPRGVVARSYNVGAKADLRNFYIASQKYFQKNPDGTIDVESAKQYGFKPTSDVKLEVRNGQRVNFMATASHPSGTDIYTIDNKGEINSIRQTLHPANDPFPSRYR